LVVWVMMHVVSFSLEGRSLSWRWRQQFPLKW